MKNLTRYFLQGLLYIAPISITFYIIYKIIQYTDGPIREYVSKWIGFQIPGLGIIVILIFLTALGYVGQSIIATPFKKIFNTLLHQIPILEWIYTAIKDFLSAIVSQDKKFNKPVLVKFSHLNNLEKIGFITDEDLSVFKIKDKVTVYFPHSYNFSGEMYIVPKDNITPLNIPTHQVMKYVVTSGVAKIEHK